MNTENLVEALRTELLEYGELLNLIDGEQTAILIQNIDLVRADQDSIRLQLSTIRHCKRRRVHIVRHLARALGQEPHISVGALIKSCEPIRRPLLHALISLKAQLINKSKQRTRQNKLLLARAFVVSPFLSERSGSAE